MSPCHAPAAHRWLIMARTTTTLPQSISIRQPPTCVNVVDPSHHPNNLLSYQPSPAVSISPRPDQQLSPHSRFSALIVVLLPCLSTCPHTSSNHLNTLLSIHYPPPPLLNFSPPLSGIHSLSSSAGIALL